MTTNPTQPATRVDVGSFAPDFVLPDASGKHVRLNDLLQEGPIVLYFYPKDNTRGCTAEACAFRDSYEVFRNAGAEVVGVSTDTEASHEKFAAQHDLPFILLSDEDGSVSKRYGATALFGLLTGRVTFVIDKTGTVQHVFNSMFSASKHVDEALEVLKRL